MLGANPPQVRQPHSAPIHHRVQCNHFEQLAAWTVRATGGQWGFRVAFLAFIGWALSGSYFDYGEAWRMVYFIATSSVTFLTVFLARNAQIRSSKALHLKLDELIYAIKQADNELIEVENRTEEELDRLRDRHRHPSSCRH